MIRKALKTSGALLVLFHVWLFARDAWAGQLVDPALLLRWGAAAGLAWALVALRRQGVSLVRGRKAVAIWVLAALLHGPALAGAAEIPDLPATPIVVTSLVSATAGAAAAASLLVLLALLATLARRRAASLASYARFDRATPGSLTPGAYLPFAQRPPPLA